MKKGGYGF